MRDHAPAGSVAAGRRPSPALGVEVVQQSAGVLFNPRSEVDAHHAPGRGRAAPRWRGVLFRHTSCRLGLATLAACFSPAVILTPPWVPRTALRSARALHYPGLEACTGRHGWRWWPVGRSADKLAHAAAVASCWCSGKCGVASADAGGLDPAAALDEVVQLARDNFLSGTATTSSSRHQPGLQPCGRGADETRQAWRHNECPAHDTGLCVCLEERALLK